MIIFVKISQFFIGTSDCYMHFSLIYRLKRYKSFIKTIQTEHVYLKNPNGRISPFINGEIFWKKEKKIVAFSKI